MLNQVSKIIAMSPLCVRMKYYHVSMGVMIFVYSPSNVSRGGIAGDRGTTTRSLKKETSCCHAAKIQTEI